MFELQIVAGRHGGFVVFRDGQPGTRNTFLFAGNFEAVTSFLASELAKVQFVPTPETYGEGAP